MKWIKGWLLGDMVKWVIDSVITRENYEALMDDLLDVFERWASRTDNALDDAAVAAIRRVLQIPEGDD